MAGPPITDTERFLARVEQRGPTQCWWWTGAIDSRNYPRMQLVTGSQQAVARFAWQYVYLLGPIPAGYVITRLEHDWEPCIDPTYCTHRLCLNPAHMTLTRKSEIDADRMRARTSQPKTHCRRNHPLSDDNVVWLSRSRNKRVCKICHDAWLAQRALA